MSLIGLQLSEGADKLVSIQSVRQRGHSRRPFAMGGGHAYQTREGGTDDGALDCSGDVSKLSTGSRVHGGLEPMGEILQGGNRSLVGVGGVVDAME